jgi:hydrogenase maturation protease
MPGRAPLLVVGYGNPSRGDDALGPELLRRAEALRAPGLEVLEDFQLQIELSLDLEGRTLVLFVDASESAAAPFEFRRLHPVRDESWSSHALHPEAVLHVFQVVQRREPPPAYLLAVRGEVFDLGEPLSEVATRNLAAASAFLTRLVADPRPEAWQALAASGREGWAPPQLRPR